MTFEHKTLAESRWQEMSFMVQMANIGSEVYRASSWLKKGKKEQSFRAIERGLELIDLSLSNAKGYPKLKELARTREVICDFFYGDNEYNTDIEMLNKYFYHFAMAANNSK